MKKKNNSRGCLSLPWGLIHVYDHYFQTSFLKLGQSKSKFCVESAWEVGKKVNINGIGHMTKMATMLIYGKNVQKASPAELLVL